MKIRLYPQISKFSGCSIFFFINLFNESEFFLQVVFICSPLAMYHYTVGLYRENLHVLIGAEAEIFKGWLRIKNNYYHWSMEVSEY